VKSELRALKRDIDRLKIDFSHKRWIVGSFLRSFLDDFSENGSARNFFPNTAFAMFDDSTVVFRQKIRNLGHFDVLEYLL
jgi:hypothetical protein